MINTTALGQRIQRFLKASGMKPTRFGHETVNDPALVSNIRSGRIMRQKIAEKISAWLDEREKM